jgi:Tol biopolymer transport system component
MKRLVIFILLGNLLLLSCKKDRVETAGSPADQPKMYFQGSTYSGAIGWEEIFSINFDGTVQRQLTNFSNGGSLPIFTGEPFLSPDSKTIYFNSTKDFTGGEIFSMDLASKQVTRIISNNITGSRLRDAFIFQDGQKIVYCMEVDSFANRHGEIFTANIDGSNITKLINYPADGNCLHPCVDPANTTIVYSNLINGRMELYAMSTTGTNKRPLTSTGSTLKLHPQFSPDGTKIVFDANFGAGVEIFIMNADGSNITRLTNYTANGSINNYSWGATFSKDGKTIYFSSDEFDNVHGQLYQMNADGTGKKKITSTVEDKFNPCVK